MEPQLQLYLNETVDKVLSMMSHCLIDYLSYVFFPETGDKLRNGMQKIMKNQDTDSPPKWEYPIPHPLVITSVIVHVNYVD
jgi:hypothetical protein